MSETKNRIREQRTLKGLSQEALAEAIGTNTQQIGRLEREDIELSVNWLKRLARAIGCYPSDLLDPRHVRASEIEDEALFVEISLIVDDWLAQHKNWLKQNGYEVSPAKQAQAQAHIYNTIHRENLEKGDKNIKIRAEAILEFAAKSA